MTEHRDAIKRNVSNYILCIESALEVFFVVGSLALPWTWYMHCSRHSIFNPHTYSYFRDANKNSEKKNRIATTATAKRAFFRIENGRAYVSVSVNACKWCPCGKKPKKIFRFGGGSVSNGERRLREKKLAPPFDSHKNFPPEK